MKNKKNMIAFLFSYTILFSCNLENNKNIEKLQYKVYEDHNETGLTIDSVSVKLRGYYIGYCKLNSVNRSVVYFLSDTMVNKCLYVPRLRHDLTGKPWVELSTNTTDSCSFRLILNNNNLENRLNEAIAPYLIDTLNEKQKEKIINEINSGFK